MFDILIVSSVSLTGRCVHIYLYLYLRLDFCHLFMDLELAAMGLDLVFLTSLFSKTSSCLCIDLFTTYIYTAFKLYLIVLSLGLVRWAGAELINTTHSVQQVVLHCTTTWCQSGLSRGFIDFFIIFKIGTHTPDTQQCFLNWLRLLKNNYIERYLDNSYLQLILKCPQSEFQGF